jgi:4-amino-4-deoxy-L-arabinose transferase-like glycosyltransferase
MVATELPLPEDRPVAAVHQELGLVKRAWALAGVFAVTALFQLATLQPNFDEGVYFFQAAHVRDGQLPFVDFFYHQTPLYLYLLAWFTSVAPATLFAARALSLLCTAISGVLVSEIARKLVGSRAAPFAQILFYTAPLAYFGLLAMPNASMVLASLLGVYGVFCRERGAYTVAAGVAFAVAVFIKPLEVSTVLAVLAAVALRAQDRSKLPLLIAGGGAAGAGLAALFHALSSGAFSEVLLLQLSRFEGRKGFEVASNWRGMRLAIEERGVDSALGWNASEHFQAFLRTGIFSGNFWLLVLALFGFSALKRTRAAGSRSLLALWALVPAAFSLLIWEPVWDHYFFQYLAPLAITAAALFGNFERRSGPARWASRFGIVAYAAWGFLARPLDSAWYERVRERASTLGVAEYLSFAPIVHVAGGTKPACGLIDPMNVYGEHCAAALSPSPALSRFKVAPQALKQCLGDDTRVLIEDYAYWFLDAELAAHLLNRQDRLVHESPSDPKKLREFYHFERRRAGLAR